GWRLFGIFIATIGGLILQPIAGGALVLIAVTLAAVFGGLTIQQTLEGYADPTVWLVMAAFFISIAMIKTGFARRLALIFVRAFGKTSLGVSYALRSPTCCWRESFPRTARAPAVWCCRSPALSPSCTDRAPARRRR